MRAVNLMRLTSRLTGTNPFKATDYEKSMYRNYKCELNFNLPGVSPDCISFLKGVLQKNPRHRFSSEEALEEEVLLKLELDENQSNLHILSKKAKRPQRL